MAVVPHGSHGSHQHSSIAAATLVVLVLAGQAAADVAHLSARVLGRVPHWVQNRTADVVLDFRKADPNFRIPRMGVINFRGKDMNVRYHIGYYHGNVAIVRYGNKFIAAVRKMHFYKILRTEIEGYPLSTRPNEGEVSWWASKIAVCSVDSLTLQPLACEDYDPRTWQECLWNRGFEGTGVEAPRLIVWPGQGLFMMFGSKPAPVNPNGVLPADTRCKGPLHFQQYLVRLQAYSQVPDPHDPWAHGPVRLDYLAEVPKPGDRRLLKEKNWNPFIYKGKLFFSQQFDPHVVLETHANGTCTKVFETTSRVFRNFTAKARGNTQAVLVASSYSGEMRDFYLGVVHAEINRGYRNFFYKMQAHPPFRIYAMSKAMPIINSRHPRNLAWEHVSFPMSLDLIPETHQVMIGYGSGDKTPRVKMMPWEDVLALFPPAAQEMGTHKAKRQQRLNNQEV